MDTFDRDETPTKMVFRRWKTPRGSGYEEGSLIALMPEIPVDERGYECDSYERMGQHGSADYEHVISATVPANPWASKEGLDLMRELEDRGYRVQVYQRQTSQMRESRRNAARIIWKQMGAITARP